MDLFSDRLNASIFSKKKKKNRVERSQLLIISKGGKVELGFFINFSFRNIYFWH